MMSEMHDALRQGCVSVVLSDNPVCFWLRTDDGHAIARIDDIGPEGAATAEMLAHLWNVEVMREEWFLKHGIHQPLKEEESTHDATD